MTAVERLETLPPSGRFIVDTTADTWKVDLDFGYATRWHSAQDAAGLADGTEHLSGFIDRVEHCTVGRGFAIVVDGVTFRPGRVLGITPVVEPAQ